MSVCVCVCEREREREKELMSVRLGKSVCIKNWSESESVWV